MPQEASKNPSPFATDVLKLVSGTAVAQVIAILASPILTRLYGPEAFGLLALFTSITGIIGVIACMRYELAIMLPKDDKDSINILGLCFLMVTIITVITGIGLFLGSGALLSVLHAQDLAPFMWLVPPFIFVSGLFLALNYWNSRTRHYGRLSIARVTSAVTTTGTQLGAGFGGFPTGGSLIGASLVGSIVSTGILGGQIWGEDGASIKRAVSWKGIVASLKRYDNYLKYDIWSALLNTLSWQAPIFLLAFFFSTSIVGFYSLSMMVIQLPMSLIGGAIAQVFYQRAAVAKSEGTVGPLVENVFRILTKIGLLPMILLLFIGKDFFIVIFGTQWAEAGIYIQILSIWAIVWFFSSPLSNLVQIFERQRWSLVYNISNIITRIISIIVGGILGNILLALFLFSISGIIVYGYLCVKMFEFSNVSVNIILDIITQNLFWIIFVGSFFLILELLKVSSIIIVTLSIILGIIYYAHLCKTDPIVYNIVNQYLMKIKRY